MLRLGSLAPGALVTRQATSCLGGRCSGAAWTQPRVTIQSRVVCRSATFRAHAAPQGGEQPPAEGTDDAVPDSLLPLFLSLDKAKQTQVETYLAVLLETNKITNLVSNSQASRGQLMVRHVEDSLALLAAVEADLQAQPLTPPPPNAAAAARASGGSMRRAGRTLVADIGSGSGFPGMVVAIARPEWDIVLVEAVKKKCAFLREAATAAGLTNLRVLDERAEDVARGPLRGACDIVIARSVAQLPMLSEYCLPFLRVGGMWAAAKNADAQDEVEAAAEAVRLLGGGQPKVVPVATVGPDGRNFTAVLSRKEQVTGELYPRNSGLIKKGPPSAEEERLEAEKAAAAPPSFSSRAGARATAQRGSAGGRGEGAGAGGGRGGQGGGGGFRTERAQEQRQPPRFGGGAGGGGPGGGSGRGGGGGGRVRREGE